MQKNLRDVDHFALAGMQAILGYEWIKGGWEKLSNADFIPGMAKTLMAFAKQNPFSAYGAWLEQIAASSATTFGYLVAWGESLVGVGLVASLCLSECSDSPRAKTLARFAGVSSLLVGAFLNANFYLATSHLSPASSGLNALMFWMQLLLAYWWAREWLSSKNA